MPVWYYNLKAQTQKAIPCLYSVRKFSIFVMFEHSLSQRFLMSDIVIVYCAAYYLSLVLCYD